MKSRRFINSSLVVALSFVAVSVARADVAIPGDASDGIFAPSESVVIDLSQAATGDWNSPSPATGKGVYDPEKWAIVFKYSSVNIPAGVVVKFKNHGSRAPVVWLVAGEVTILGDINLDGEGGNEAFADGQRAAEPGPGGFRGGFDRTQGFGPGGGRPDDQGVPAAGGSYATLSGLAGGPSGLQTRTYGNSSILPLIGGSGGGSAGGGSVERNGFGGGGGGAILIAANTTVTLNGNIYAGPGEGTWAGGTGSGGAVRIIAGKMLGSGKVSAVGRAAGSTAGDGRIRLETLDYSASWTLFPRTVAVQPANPPALWPAENAPHARVLSVAGANVPADPRSGLSAAGTDLQLQTSGEVELLVETRRLPLDSTVTVIVNTLKGFAVRKGAEFQNGDANLAIWVAKVAVPDGFAAVQVHATAP